MMIIAIIGIAIYVRRTHAYGITERHPRNPQLQVYFTIGRLEGQ